MGGPRPLPPAPSRDALWEQTHTELGVVWPGRRFPYSRSDMAPGRPDLHCLLCLSTRTRAALSAGSVNAFYVLPSFLPPSSHPHKHIIIVELMPLTSLRMRVQGEMGIYATLQGGCVSWCVCLCMRVGVCVCVFVYALVCERGEERGVLGRA